MPRYTTVLDEPSTINLDDFPTDDTGKIDRAHVRAQTSEIETRLSRLQELLYAAGQQSVLIVLQGMDTAGKDGTVAHVMGQINPTGCRVWSFKVPTEEEQRHDFLWRIHQRTPERGMIAIFNRSHYEDVLVPRVHKLVPHHVIEERYEQINQFERLLASASATIILKFFLHISKKEQERRLQAREDDPEKRWKLSAGDFHEREFWNDYRQAYEALLGHCSTKWAPWHIVPSDKKWFRNFAVAQAIVDSLAEHEDEWSKAVIQRGEQAYEQVRAAHGIAQHSHAGESEDAG
jgi:PPK2 family polyphosphate:nucleotide phosphotransferase